VSERLRRAVGIATLPTVALVVVVLALPGWTRPALHAWLLVVLAIGLVALLAGIRDSVPTAPSGFDAALARRATAPARPPSLAKVEREVSMGVETAFDTHYRLRPLFRRLTAGLLLAHRGVDLERDPERARALVGDDLWALVRPDAAAPEERSGAGVQPAALERAVADLERIAWS
jgi:hypothetical protein